MHFSLWIPGQTAERPAQQLVDVGLPALAANFTHVRKPREPGGEVGTLFLWSQPGHAALGPTQPDWIPAEGIDGAAERYWIGLDRNCQPQDLRRHRTFPGRSVLLGDGNHWLIPVMQRLPLTISMTATGLELEPVRIYEGVTVDAEFLQETQDWRRLVMQSDDSTELDWQGLWTFAYRALLVNYRLTVEVVNALKLFNDQALRYILLVAIGAWDDAEHLRQLKADIAARGGSLDE